MEQADLGDDFDFRDRHVRLGLTFGGAGVIRGDLTPEWTSLARSPVGKERPCHFSATPTTSSFVAGKLVPSPAWRVTRS
ncbi:MAG: hypothetical protein JWO75_2568, partial [Actinomycetia bacterium]|nr:hypothetical protein [Actinomycetes bacterium]